jgi:D-alanyl-D-alanine carboxypeptidase
VKAFDRMPAGIATLLLVVSLAACAGGGTTAAPSASPTSGPPASPDATPNRTPDLQGVLDYRLKSSGAPGALAVLRVGGARRAFSSGAADLAGTPITETTRFRIASITKPIVAALVLDAVSRGELSLDDTVDDLLPGVLRPGSPITIRRLLDHTSGIYDEYNEGDPIADIENLADPKLRAEARAMARRIAAAEPLIAPAEVVVALAETHDRYFEPGAGWHYSNAGYMLAGMVLEQVTGQPLGDLLRTRIVQPLGLVHTTIAPPDTASPELRGYLTKPPYTEFEDVTDDLAFMGNGAHAGIVTTADELLAIMGAIVSGRLLPADLVAEMKEPNEESSGLGLSDNLESYGLGLSTYRLSCGTFYGHTGAVNGTGSIAVVSPDGADGVVIAMNLLTDRSDPGLEMLADIMLCAGR